MPRDRRAPHPARLAAAALGIAALLAPLAARPAPDAGHALHPGHRSVVLAGVSAGRAGGFGRVGLRVNGVDFVLPTAPAGSGGLSAAEACEALRDALAGYTVGLNAAAEFDARCLDLAAGAALLVFEANPERFPPPAAEDDAITGLVKRKRRHLDVVVVNEDDGLTIRPGP